MNEQKHNEVQSEPKNEYGRRSFYYRYLIIGAFFVVMCVVYIASAFKIQSLFGERDHGTDDGYTTRKVAVQAMRGEIYDRNGNILVSNDYNYKLIYDYSAMAKTVSEQNDDILAILSLLEGSDCRAEKQCPFKGIYPNITFDADVLKSSTVKARLERIIADHGLSEDASAAELARSVAQRYGMIKNGEAVYSPAQMSELIRVRYEMEAIRFSAVEPYVFGENLDIAIITAVRERGIRGADLKVEYTRLYHYPGYASHILGRISVILAEDAEYYTSLGYPLTAKVGISGCELAFENYLRGMDGEMTITEDEDGNIVSREITKEPVAGNDVYLTIDIFLQMAAEDALADNIQRIIERAESLEGDLDGEDCDAGAIVVQTAKGGEILALGSHPTFNLATFNKDFSELVNDPRRVYTNRALMGQYRPGSTVKIGMSVAALAEPLMVDGNLFTSTTKINTQGIYTFYDDYQPECWLYSDYHMSHGPITLSKAISVSCNWFYFELGRIMGIDRINRYFTLFGMGQKTGIELAENTGILADQAYKQTLNLPASDRTWMPGDTLQTSIGVGYSEHTPLQISNYISMIVNGGTRYAAHLLKEVRTFSGEVVYTTEPQILAEVSIDEATSDAIKEGMNGALSSSGVLKASFGDFPAEIGAGGKTGTAQTSANVSNNAVFVSFAPLDDPEIVVACIIERGAHGYNASWAARAVFDKYFGLTSEE
ncbi:MAG: penicillin-binding transpeptidase domain-containing protein [Eubacteriales bacterium]